MMGCACKRGFFSLRDCGDPVSTTCSSCGRGVCAAHLSPASGFSQCLDCHARGAQAQTQAQPPSTTKRQVSPNAADDEWVYGYRNSYYRTGYGPIYSGYYYDHYYDSYDTRTFDRAAAANPPDDDKPDAETNFGES
jgi:hypothetical protein